MIILGIETATPTGGAALWVDGRIVAQARNDGQLSHSQRLMPGVQQILWDAKLQLSQVDGIAVSIGPGSFTGLRIGLAVAKALAHFENKPVLAVPTLEALAMRFAREGMLLAPLLDARRSEVFGAMFRSDGTGRLERLSPDVVESPEVFIERLQAPCIVGGPGAIRYHDLLQDGLNGRVEFAAEDANEPSAAVVAEIGARKLAAAQTANVLTLEPVYVRKSDAELAACSRQMKS